MESSDKRLTPGSPPIVRALTAGFICGATAWLSWAAQVYVSHKPGGDLLWAMTAGADLLFGRDPYRYVTGPYWTPYPLPAAFVGLPFSFFPPAIGAALFFGVSSGLLAYGIARTDNKRLLIFTSLPFWFALVWAQWSPLIMAAAFIPVLLPVILIKPQIALPVGLNHFTRVGFYCCVLVATLSLLLYPRWPLVWLSQIGQYQRFFPILTIPIGPVLLLALLRWRDPDVRLFLLAAVFPQRHFYDAFILWLIPRTRKEILPTAAISWGAWIWKANRPNMTTSEVGLVSCLFFFLPILCVILLRPTVRPERG